MTDSAKAAGGRATETGMASQGVVTSWFAVQMLADAALGSVFGLPEDRKISGLQCETGDAMDDIVLRLDGGGAIYIQCKTGAGMTSGAESALGKAVAQLVDLYSRIRPSSSCDERVRAVLAVPEGAPRTLNILGWGAGWGLAQGALNAAVRP
jgi:hypothetical protein